MSQFIPLIHPPTVMQMMLLSASPILSYIISSISSIEHLDETNLNGLPDAVFGVLRPKHVVVSTPNADYNVIFPNFTGFRHWDHKFEWTRCEFSKWCNKVCSSYNYHVEFSGVGDPKPGFEHVGSCTQIAIFTHVEHVKQVKDVELPEDIFVTYKEVQDTFV